MRATPPLPRIIGCNSTQFALPHGPVHAPDHRHSRFPAGAASWARGARGDDTTVPNDRRIARGMAIAHSIRLVELRRALRQENAAHVSLMHHRTRRMRAALTAACERLRLTAEATAPHRRNRTADSYTKFHGGDGAAIAAATTRRHCSPRIHGTAGAWACASSSTLTSRHLPIGTRRSRRYGERNRAAMRTCAQQRSIADIARTTAVNSTHDKKMRGSVEFIVSMAPHANRRYGGTVRTAATSKDFAPSKFHRLTNNTTATQTKIQGLNARDACFYAHSFAAVRMTCSASHSLKTN